MTFFTVSAGRRFTKASRLAWTRRRWRKPAGIIFFHPSPMYRPQRLLRTDAAAFPWKEEAVSFAVVPRTLDRPAPPTPISAEVKNPRESRRCRCSRLRFVIHETANLFAHLLDLLFHQLGKHRERQNALRQSLGVWEISLPVAQIGIGRLQVDARRIVNPRLNPALVQEFPQCVAATGLPDEEVIDMLGFWKRHLKADAAHCFEQQPVTLRMCNALLIPFSQVVQFHFEDGGLQSVESSIQPFFGMIILDNFPVVAEASYSSRELLVIRRDHPAVASGPQVFRWIETEASCDSHRTTSVRDSTRRAPAPRPPIRTGLDARPVREGDSY